MPNYKSLKTYSKTQKVVRYSTLFDNPQSCNLDSDTSKIEDKPEVIATISKSKSTSDQNGPDNKIPEPEPEPEIAEASEISKRKARVDYNPITKTKKVSKAKTVKLFQMSNMDSSDSASSSACAGGDSMASAVNNNQGENNTCGEIEEKMKDGLVISNTVGKVEEAGTTQKKTMSSSKSSTSLKRPAVRGRPKKTDKENKTEDKIGRIKKSKSTSNVLSSKKMELINSGDNTGDLVGIKSIMKSQVQSKQSNDNKVTKVEDKIKPPVAKAKKAVKILEEINYKTDEITNFKIDNRTKHAASTSTPSGLRRRPLKMSTELSMIATPDKVKK